MDANKKDAQWRQSLQVSVVSPACVDAQFSHTQTAHQWGILSVTFVSGHSHGSLTWELVKASTKQIHKYLQWSICFGCVMSCLVCCNETACGVGIHFSVLRVKSYFQLLLCVWLSFLYSALALCASLLCCDMYAWYETACSKKMCFLCELTSPNAIDASWHNVVLVLKLLL